ncbi:hypothetical protein DBIPINDM_003201 [Mesorhizobium sp. AR02]|uniref:hypothetical protein n=1 Tax=Mesorhizobium sp. AR02 TaxID=2865837 RepID=UPI00216032FB|nr:hypothetical protein [Mesorhizobium sp. AR02]UVK56584.1 hypothetical protein DBIPINDM_003201 [Mesorhizobium sp. AR02]
MEGKVGSVPAFLLFSGLMSGHRATVIGQCQSISPFHGNGEPLYLFVFAQFRTENRSHFSWNCARASTFHIGILSSPTLTLTSLPADSASNAGLE